MNSNFRHLRAFVAVAECLNFTKAAEKICITQPALSALIQQLETDLDVKLLQRNTRAVELTPIGNKFYITSTKIISDFNRAIDDVQSYVSLVKGHVSIAALPTICASILPKIIKYFQSQNPKIEIQILDIPGSEIINALESRKVDLAIGYSDTEKNLNVKNIFRDELVVLCKPEFFKDNIKNIKWTNLKDIPVIAMSKKTTVRALMQQATIAKKLHLNIVLEPRLISSAIAYADEGLGITILPSSIASDVLPKSLTTFKLINPVIHRDISLITLSNYSLSPAAQELYNIICHFEF